MSDDELKLRILLAISYSGINLYSDDGELQDNLMLPHIDFKRDSVNEIESKIHQRNAGAVIKCQLLKQQ